MTRIGEYSLDTFWLRMRKNCHSKVTLLGKLQVYWQSSGRGWMSENNCHSDFLFWRLQGQSLVWNPGFPLILHFIRFCKNWPLKCDITAGYRLNSVWQLLPGIVGGCELVTWTSPSLPTFPNSPLLVWTWKLTAFTDHNHKVAARSHWYFLRTLPGCGQIWEPEFRLEKWHKWKEQVLSPIPPPTHPDPLLGEMTVEMSLKPLHFRTERHGREVSQTLMCLLITWGSCLNTNPISFGVWDFAFLISFWMMLSLLVGGLHFE